MKVYFPNVLTSIVQVLPCAPAVARVADVASLDQGPEHHPLAVFISRWPGEPDKLQQFLRKASAW